MSIDPPVVDLRRVEKVYLRGGEEVRALKGVDLRVERGEYAGIVGPSGSGKSTMLNVLGCLDSPTRGEYWLDGAAVHALGDLELARTRNAKLGFVFQSFNLLPRFTARQNVMLPMSYSGTGRRERDRRAREALERVGLGPRVEHRPSELSGGERQRVAIARALVNRPRVLLADEPTGNLDQRVGSEIVQLFESLNRDDGVTVLLVTHDPVLAARCGRVIRIVDGLIVEDRRAA